ncbi:MAG: hypothetical protein ACRDOL_24280, partial [Streptosporangiaceae bacterium]
TLRGQIERHRQPRPPLFEQVAVPAVGLLGAAANPDLFVNSVACASASSCVAAGDYVDSSGGLQGVLLTGSGASWTATKVPLPADANAADPNVSLSSVACASASSCVAVGSYSDSAEVGHALLLTGSGTSWTATEAPLPAGADPGAGLNSVTCPSASSCVAAGTYTDSAGDRQGLLLTGLGTSWTATGAPAPAGAAADPGTLMNWITCPSASSCVAVGSYTDSAANVQGMLLTGSGTSWTATEAPLPANAAADQSATGLDAVACSSPSSCVVAGGSYTDSAGIVQGLLLTGSGTSWTATEAPLPANARAVTNAIAVWVDAVACPAASSCVATGHYDDSAGNPQGVLLTGSGTSWTATETPLPAGATAGGLTSVTCSSPSSCVAAGGYQDSAADGHGLLLTGSGTSWTATETPLPANAGADPNAYESSVTCPSASSCVMIGQYVDSSGHQQGLLVSATG